MIASIAKGLILTAWLLAFSSVIVLIGIGIKLFQDKGRKK